MKSTYSITRAQAKLPGLIRESVLAPVSITRHNETVAYIVSREQMEAITETLELLATPAAVEALRASQEGLVAYTLLDEIVTD